MSPTQPERREPEYVVAPRPVRRRSRRRLAIVLVAGCAFIALVVVKPWGGGEELQPLARATTPSASAPTNSNASPAAIAAVVPAPPETWPVTHAGDAAVGTRDPRDPSVVSWLVSHTGTWGIATLGSGPRVVREEPWVDWAAVAAERSARAADRISTWPGTGICTGLPVVFDLPSLVAVTAPSTVADDPPIEGWWSDGGRIVSLDASIRVASPFDGRGITYLERVDGSAWPAGRYAFDVGGGDEIVSLVVCLTRSG